MVSRIGSAKGSPNTQSKTGACGIAEGKRVHMLRVLQTVRNVLLVLGTASMGRCARSRCDVPHHAPTLREGDSRIFKVSEVRSTVVGYGGLNSAGSFATRPCSCILSARQ